ncbi:DUF5009 domain-containing protein [Chitinophaga sedimenti]|uniref:DUF5009 domain-containing protein n=1 Tax=Chitinophaga sedimenti TaxID=2033606 RepID=UPI0020033F49|nr:DUF5009 domain-containing protein [Chitinophaga sedimenti]MCK7557483.1 DUF5009 domain-containing protein [Chitinophaga sedimenti]
MERSNSLDALRGLAILAMVLSGSIAFGRVLPAWMFHARVPPPFHVFDPNLPGITWVDLVFPFFLFSMGAALPLALHKRVEQDRWYKTFGYILQRYLLLVFFALFTVHARSKNIGEGPWSYLLSMGCFVLLCFMYIRQGIVIKVVAFALAVLFLYFTGFDVKKNDIIIMVLANMAFFGSLIWWATRHQPLLRLGILPFIMAVFLAGKTEGTWNNALFNWSPAPWMYTFYFLKYLFIIIPGTFAGEWLLQKSEEASPEGKSQWITVAVVCLALIGVQLWGLYTRELLINLGITVALCVFLLSRRLSSTFFKKYLHSGIYLLLLGLAFEAYEGGIKKDPSTYSYYFVTGGLAFLLLLSFSIFEYYGYGKKLFNFFAGNGKNPMVAYTAGNLILIPLLLLTGGMRWLDALSVNALGGFMRGIVFTGVVSLITLFFVKRKWFWKT